MIKILTDEKNELYGKVAAQAFETLDLSGGAAVELVIASKDEIRALNARTRQKDAVTDVLSFPMLEKILPFTQENYPADYDGEIKSVMLGSIVICDEVAKEQAAEYGHSEERERAYLFLHGLLHLLGYDHIEESDKKAMREKEEEILKALDIVRGGNENL